MFYAKGRLDLYATPRVGVRVRVGEESFSTEPFASDVRKVCCETFATEPFLGIHDIGFLRNHLYGTFFTIFQKEFRRKPQFSRNQKKVPRVYRGEEPF